MRASKVKKQLLQTKLPQLQKSKFLLRRPSRLSLERLPAGSAFFRLA
jgi:predicted ATPase